MSDLAPDEKLCPFCAETIKKAAIKCRYCGSELPAEESVEQPVPVAQPAPAATTVPEQPAAASSESSRPTRRYGMPSSADDSATSALERHASLGSSLVTGVLVLLIALALVVSVTVYRSVRDDTVAPNGQQTSPAVRNDLLGQASSMMTTVFSYKASSFDADTAKAEKLMTASMAAQFQKTAAAVRPGVVKNSLSQTAKVQAAGMVSITDSEAKVLEFVDQSTTTPGSTNQQLVQARVVLTLERAGSRWLISKIDAF